MIDLEDLARRTHELQQRAAQLRGRRGAALTWDQLEQGARMRRIAITGRCQRAYAAARAQPTESAALP